MVEVKVRIQHLEVSLQAQCPIGPDKYIKIYRSKMLLQFRNLIVGAFFIYLSIIGLIGCYTQPGTPGELNRISYRHHLGKATSFGFQEVTRQIFSKYGYAVDRFDKRSAYLTIESNWKLRQPTASELINGFSEAKTQIIITANLERSATSKFTADLFSCNMGIKNLVNNNQDWVEFYNSPELKSSMDKIANDIKDEFLLTMRQF